MILEREEGKEGGKKVGRVAGGWKERRGRERERH